MAQKSVIPKNKLRNSGAETYFVGHWSKLDAFCKFTNFIQKCIVCPLVTRFSVGVHCCEIHILQITTVILHSRYYNC